MTSATTILPPSFTTLLAYYYYTESNLVYLFKSGPARKRATQFVRILFLALTFFGTYKGEKVKINGSTQFHVDTASVAEVKKPSARFRIRWVEMTP